MKKHTVNHIVIGITLICFYVVTYGSLLQRHTNSEAYKQHHNFGMWNLPPTALLAIVGEFRGIVADYLTLEIGAVLGTKVLRKHGGGFKVVKRFRNWPMINQMFVASQVLDPAFAQTFMVAQGWLPWAPANMVEETQKILETAARSRPWDWRPNHAIGFNTYFFLKNPGEAGRIYLKTAKIPNAPQFLSIIGARLAQENGETKAAIALLKSMLVDQKKHVPGFADMMDRLHALEGVLVIEEAVARYEKNKGSKPISFDELIASGAISSMPKNPYKVKYCIDSSGSIYFDKPHCNQ